MFIHRTNMNAPASGDECFRAMQRAAAKPGSATPARVPAEVAPAASGSPPEGGDVIYGAKAIAGYLFADQSNRARRRVFGLWAHYSKRKERAGFFKLKGALCLSKKQWLAFHGLG
jgi:hypothetical protein